MADQSTTYEEIIDDDFAALDELTDLAPARPRITADEARAQGPRKRLTVPSDFDGQEFCRDDNLVILANQLIRDHSPTLDHVRNLRVAYLWKRKGGVKGGKGTLGKCQSLASIAQFALKADILIWLAADNCRDLYLNGPQLEALLFHELLHIGWDVDKGQAAIVDHDFAGFLKELEIYGAWDSDLERLARHAGQLARF